jgi:cytidine deaminase
VETLTQQQIDALLETAKVYRLRAYAPYSGFKVGAAVLTASGRLYGGCNVENASHPAGRCAEQTAVQKAVSEGETELLAVAALADGTGVCLPCGVCRQVLGEFNPDMWVVMANLSGAVEVVRLSELMPRPFRMRQDANRPGEG